MDKGARPRTACVLILFLLLCVYVPQSAFAQRATLPPPQPLRVAYIEGGPYPDFTGLLQTLAQALEDMGLVAEGSVPATGGETRPEGMWQWLSQHAGGEYLTFVPDACYTAGWNTTEFEKKKDALIHRIREKKDIDLVLAMGTMAALPMATADIAVPVMVLGSFDPASSGIIASVQDSGRENVFALVREQRYYREIMLFHSIFKFARLGVTYEDTPLGRAQVAYTQVEKAAKDAHFELVTCVRPYVKAHFMDVATMIDCNEYFVQQGVDAVYLTIGYGVGEGRMDEVLRPLTKANLPTFAQVGAPGVKSGVLMSISEESFKGEALFAAKALANILAGQSPRSQKQSYEGSLSLAVNFRTAGLIGWYPPLAVLAAVDDIVER